MHCYISDMQMDANYNSVSLHQAFSLHFAYEKAAIISVFTIQKYETNNEYRLCYSVLRYTTLPCIHILPLNLRPTAGSPYKSAELIQISNTRLLHSTFNK